MSWCEVKIKFIFLPYVYPVVVAPCVKKTLLFILNYLDIFVENQLSVCGSTSGLSILFHSSVCHQCHTVSTTEALQKV